LITEAFCFYRSRNIENQFSFKTHRPMCIEMDVFVFLSNVFCDYVQFDLDFEDEEERAKM